jgi:Tfp pilus tip-associated adhesin PilY1
MKKSLFILLISFVFLFLAGCTNSDDQDTENQENETAETEEQESNDPETDEVAENEEEDTQATAEEEETDANNDLTLQLTKVDEENGSTLESGIYSEINQLMEENPNMGTENDFSVFTVDVYNTEAGRSLVLLGINRTPVELTNVSFDLNLGSNEAFVLEDQPVNLSEEEMGVFPVNGVMPFIIDISDEQADALLNINAAEVLLTLDNFEYEEAG